MGRIIDEVLEFLQPLRVARIDPLGPGAVASLGQVTAPSAISAADTNLLTLGTDDAVQMLSFGAGSGAYTYNIDLDKTGAVEVNMFLLRITKAASLNPTIVVRNGSAGATLLSLNDVFAYTLSVIAIYNGTDWVLVQMARDYVQEPIRFAGFTANAQVSSATTYSLSVGDDAQAQSFDAAAGSGAYAVKIQLDTAGAAAGDVFLLKIVHAASANPTITVETGTAGSFSAIKTINSASAETYLVIAVFSGTAWVLLDSHLQA